MEKFMGGGVTVFLLHLKGDQNFVDLIWINKYIRGNPSSLPTFDLISFRYTTFYYILNK